MITLVSWVQEPQDCQLRKKRQWQLYNLGASVMWWVIVFFLLNFQCLKQYMQLAIREGCGSPITCPDMVCLNHGTLQEAEVWMGALIFPFSLLTWFPGILALYVRLYQGVQKQNTGVNFLKEYFIVTYLGFFMEAVKAVIYFGSIYKCPLSVEEVLE